MDGETIIALLLFVLLAVLLAFLLLPLIAFIRSRHIPRLIERIQILEAELRQVQLGGSLTLPPGEEPKAGAASVEALLQTLNQRVQRLEAEWQQLKPLDTVLEVLPVSAPPPPQAGDTEPRARIVPLRERPAPRPLPSSKQTDAALLEDWLGRRGLGWTAVVLLLFATAFFIKYAFDNNWIGPLGRVSIGLFIGAALCVGGWELYRRGWRRFSQMLTGGGVAVLYLATFGAFAYYRLLPRQQAAVFLVVLIAETAALALLYDAPAIAVMAVIGGLLNPILLSTGLDEYRSLFIYLVILNAGVVGLALVRTWPFVSTIALLGTQALFWMWYEEHYHPEKRLAAIGFLTAIFVLYFLHPLRRLPAAAPAGWLARLGRRRVDPEDLVGLVLNPLFFAWAGYVLLDPDYHAWMGTAALGMAIVFTARAWLVLHFQPEDELHILVATAVGLSFLAMVFPLQAEAAWIGLGWAVLGLALWWFGLRIDADALRIFGVVWLVLAVGRLVFVDMPWVGRQPFIPVINRYTVPGLAIAACVLAAALAARRYHPVREGPERVVQVIAGLTGVGLVWLLLSIDTYQFFTTQIGRSQLEPQTLRRLAQVSLSVLWAVYAGLVLTVGFRLSSQPLRLTALGLFAVTLAKVILLDMAGLSGFYRVTAFFVLSLVMGAGAWGYQQLEATQQQTRPRASGNREGP